MKTSRYTEAQIIAILRQAEGAAPDRPDSPVAQQVLEIEFLHRWLEILVHNFG